jgi:hypothetical protein
LARTVEGAARARDASSAGSTVVAEAARSLVADRERLFVSVYRRQPGVNAPAQSTPLETIVSSSSPGRSATARRRADARCASGPPGGCACRRRYAKWRLKVASLYIDDLDHGSSAILRRIQNPSAHALLGRWWRAVVWSSSTVLASRGELPGGALPILDRDRRIRFASVWAFRRGRAW